MDYYQRTLIKIRAKKTVRHIRNETGRAEKAGREYIPTQKLQQRVRRAPSVLRPFVGIDGEGGGTNANGQQNYLLLRAGNRLPLFHDNQPLTTRDCLEYIASLPRGPIYVGFYFGYDATQILRDLLTPSNKGFDYIEALFREPTPEKPWRGTRWANYQIDYLSGQYLRVARVDPYSGRYINGSAVTVYEVGGCFQGSFVTALEQWGIGSAEDRAAMRAMKQQRGEFVEITPEIADYNRQECEWLADLMEVFRASCHAAGVRPRTWNGAGKLASAMLREHKVMKAARVREVVPAPVIEAAQAAYYGGRAELFRPGFNVMVEQDRRSAYPADMSQLPCLECATWQRLEPEDIAWLSEADLFLADVSFWHPRNTIIGGLPWRTLHGRLRWPRMGRGTYWSPELFAAQRIGTELRKFHGGWLAVRECEHRPFAFIPDVYAERQRLDAASPGSGTPLKLAINSMYGKCAQRIGDPPYQNHVWAGLTTAGTRAAMLDACASVGPQSIIAIATDAVFSTEPLPVPLGRQLGEWEQIDRGASFFALPGVYWQQSEAAARLVKTRGMGKPDLVANTERLEAAYREFLDRLTRGGAMLTYPKIEFPVPGFVGLRLAYSRGAPATAGKWTAGEEAMRELNMDWSHKRRGLRIHPDKFHQAPHGVAIQTYAQDGNIKSVSSSWNFRIAHPELLLDTDHERFRAEAQPDGDDDPITTRLVNGETR